ncbi:extracellular matrix regulator RemB [uncultured Subdoligranulum sp.]|mgnify:FL=1|uniref:extracellular matrix regulator RemB n=1 Tax=uncultured Subdoligranulum sp. TaxID=512298 RepID=UPI00262B0861|nr:extracellular matrix/biofilm biosynthesis regulator RemA family protein [uncultured Subdoligranulum sp.]
MYFHAGQDFVLNTRDVLGVFDLDTAGASRRTGDYLRRAEQEGAVVDLCAPGTLPKSFLVTDFPGETVYVSPLSPAALKKRAERSDMDSCSMI